MLTNIVPKPGCLAHDGGCGTGYWSIPILLKSQAEKVICTDYTQKMLDIAKERFKETEYFKQGRIDLRRMDLTNEWPIEKFDVQIFHLLLHYLPYNKWEDVLRQAYISTKPGGYVISTILLEGFTMEKAGKKYLAGQFLRMLFSKAIFNVGKLKKAMREIKKLDDFLEKGIIKYPNREEFIKKHEQIGFETEIVGEFLKEWGVIVVGSVP